MSELLHGIDAVTFDFFNTLVFHREGHGRGAAVTRYLAEQGIEAAPWRHEVLYEIFDGYDRVGAPSASPDARRKCRLTVAERLFRSLEVSGGPHEAERHATPLWKRLGPECLAVFSDVRETLDALRAAGYPLVIISNWPHGLGHFCAELGLLEHFDAVFCSAEVGAAKPDPRIFAAAVAHLGVAPERILHVGDTVVDDYEGGRAAGLRTVLRERGSGTADRVEHVIRGLDELTAGLQRP